MNIEQIRKFACNLKGVKQEAGKRLPNGVPAKLADYLGCSVSYARRLLSGQECPNPQMIKLMKGDRDMITVKRTGMAPLAFEGELVAEAEGSFFNGREQNRWHDLRLYRTQGGQYVLSIEYHTQWEGEADKFTAEILDPSEVAEYLESYNPTLDPVGFPPGKQYQDRQQRMLDQVERIYNARVTELLDGITELADRIE